MRSALGRLLDRLGRRVEQLVPGPIAMPLLAAAQWVDGEPELKCLHEFVPADRLAVDIGAAEGIWSWFLARRARAVVAFEANPESVERIRRRLPRVQVYAVALSNCGGEADLRIPIVRGQEFTGWATIEPANGHTALTVEGTRTVRVPTRPLDAYKLENVGFIKIDVEGHELAVLEGAVNTIRRNQPVILVEAEDRHRPRAIESVNAMLVGLGYQAAPKYSALSSPNMFLFVPK